MATFKELEEEIARLKEAHEHEMRVAEGLRLALGAAERGAQLYASAEQFAREKQREAEEERDAAREAERSAQDEAALMAQCLADIADAIGMGPDAETNAASVLAAVERTVAARESERVARLMDHANEYALAMGPSLVLHPQNADARWTGVEWIKGLVWTARMYAEEMERLRGAWESGS